MEKFRLFRIRIFSINRMSVSWSILALFRVEVHLEYGITEKGAADLIDMSSIIKISGDILRGEKITDVIRTEQKKFPLGEYKFPVQSMSYFEPLRSSI